MPDLFDDMGEAVADYNYVVNDSEPAVGEVHEGQIEMADFMAAALRPVDGVRTVWALFDVQENIPKQEWSDIVRAIQTKNYASLPQAEAVLSHFGFFSKRVALNSYPESMFGILNYGFPF